MSSTRPTLKNLCCADPVFAERYEGWEEIGQGVGVAIVATMLVRGGLAWIEMECVAALAPGEES